LGVIRRAFVSIYALILGVAFYYQVIGDESLQLYQSQRSLLETVLIDLIRDGVRTLATQILLIAALVLALILQLALINHVLKLRDERGDDDRGEN